MSTNTTELVRKLNFVISARRFKEKEYIEDFPILPSTLSEEEEVVRSMMFQFIKKLFVGCKIRPNAHSFSLRLDGQIHRKANKIREIYNNDQEWRRWFEQNHTRIYRTMRDNRSSFGGGVIEQRQVDDKTFLYIPFTPNRIYNYINSGLSEICQWLEGEYQREQSLAGIYEDVTRLIEEETQRRETERRERIERELREYTREITSRLYRPVAHLQESEDAVDRLFAQKFREWARENGKPPEVAIPATAAEMVVRDLKVKIMAPPGSEEEGWVALPPFEGYTTPENYEVQGWGKVTDVNFTADRSRNGTAPVVVQDYLYTEFNLDHWKHLLPAGYAEILEVSERLRAEAEAEVAPWLEQERILKEREEAEAQAREQERLRVQEEERRQVEEQVRRQAQEEQERRERLSASLEAQRQALAERREQEAQVVEVPTAEVEEETPARPNQALLDALRAQVSQPQPVQEAERATEEGLYRNSMAIPLERYVAINASGDVRRFASSSRAARWLGLTGTVTIRDYHVPHVEVERLVHEDEEESFPF